jgi:hypothetical protein
MTFLVSSQGSVYEKDLRPNITGIDVTAGDMVTELNNALHAMASRCALPSLRIP